MGKETHIEWTHATFNPWEGCTKISPGCKNCYALNRNLRFHGGANWGSGAPRRRTGNDTWREPVRMNARAQAEIDKAIANHLEPSIRWPRRPRIFCASLADWLDPEVPVRWLEDLLGLIAETPHLNWQLLTKRLEFFHARLKVVVSGAADSERPGVILAREWLAGRPPANVWLGTSVEDQTRADIRLPLLHLIPARIRFLSVEPLLSRVDLHGNEAHGLCGIDWCIVGGESGPDRRDCGMEAIANVAAQCLLAGTSCFIKQDCAPKAGTRGRLTDELWALKQFPPCA